MNTLLLINTSARQQAGKNIPSTARGRALHTVEWFLYGSPRSIDYDSETMPTKGVFSC